MFSVSRKACATTVLPSRTKASALVSSGRSVALPEAVPEKSRSFPQHIPLMGAAEMGTQVRPGIGNRIERTRAISCCVSQHYERCLFPPTGLWSKSDTSGAHGYDHYRNTSEPPRVSRRPF